MKNYILCFGFWGGVHPAVHRFYFWLCAQGSLLGVSGDHIGWQWLNRGGHMQGNALPTVLPSSTENLYSKRK